MKKRLFLYAPDPNDATSFYRAYGPLSRLHGDEAVETIFVENVTWSSAVFCDVALLQRPFAEQHLQAIEILKSVRKPIWIDYDDDLLAVPRSNPAFGIFGTKEASERIARICSMADHITVSTDAIAKRMRQFNRNVTVIPNAMDDRLFDWWRPRRSPREKIVMWRGGQSHVKDMMYVTPSFLELSHDPELADWMFHFQGYNPWWMTDAMRPNHTQVAPMLDLMNYFRFIHDVNPALMVVPLVPDDFNRAKSNIAWIEGTFAGAAVVAPDLPEWRQPGVILYDGSPKDFAVKTKDAMLGNINLEAAWKLSWEAVREKFLLPKMNQRRMDVLNSLHSMAANRRIRFDAHPKQVAFSRPVEESDGELELE